VTEFLDTNILVHAFAPGPSQQKARTMLYAGGAIGVQSLNEFALTARRRLAMPWPAIHAALEFIRQRCTAPIALTLDIHLEGLRLAERYQLQVYDAMLLAAALQARCQTFWSEDMHDGLVIDGRLTIRNPFA
jgi:predicted nucleic acid-binding protein